MLFFDSFDLFIKIHSISKFYENHSLSDFSLSSEHSEDLRLIPFTIFWRARLFAIDRGSRLRTYNKKSRDSDRAIAKKS